MSLTTCKECAGIVNTDDDPEFYADGNDERCEACREKRFAEEFAYHCRHAYDPRLDSEDTATRLSAYMQLKEPWNRGG